MITLHLAIIIIITRPENISSVHYMHPYKNVMCIEFIIIMLVDRAWMQYIFIDKMSADILRPKIRLKKAPPDRQPEADKDQRFSWPH